MFIRYSFVATVLIALGHASNQRDIRCYSCTSIIPEQVLSQITDPAWQQWLSNIRDVPKSSTCQDNFKVDQAIRDKVEKDECSDGVCLKLKFKDTKENTDVFRSCIPNANIKIRPDCTKISSSDGDLEVCICDGNLCNAANIKHYFIIILIISSFLYVIL